MCKNFCWSLDEIKYFDTFAWIGQLLCYKVNYDILTRKYFLSCDLKEVANSNFELLSILILFLNYFYIFGESLK